MCCFSHWYGTDTVGSLRSTFLRQGATYINKFHYPAHCSILIGPQTVTVFQIRYILFLDPHVEHLKKLGATLAKPGAKLNFAKKDIHLCNCWSDKFSSWR